MGSTEERDTPESKEQKEKMDIYEIAQRAMGDVGKWQLIICLWVSAVKVPIAWTQLGIVFLAAPSEYHCVGSVSECYTNTSQECSQWEYDRSTFHETIITQWNLVCERSQLVNVAQMIVMVGILIGNILFSIAADRYGRKYPLILSGMLQMLTGVCTAFVPSYSLFLCMRFLQAVSTGGTMTIGFVLCMEIFGGKWRTILSVLSHIPFNIGHMTMVAIAYYTRNWRYFQLAISLPSLFMIAYWWLVPESPRWLIAVGKHEEAFEVLKEAAYKNKNQIPVTYSLPKNENPEKEKEDEKKATIMDLLRTPNMRKKTLSMCFNWFACGLCFYGLAQYVSQIGGNIFINVIISGSLVIPGMLITVFMLDKYGRKKTLITGQMLSSICCFVIIFFPKDSHTSNLPTAILGSIGILGSGIAFPTAYLYSGELFPTVVRNVGVGSGSMCARFGSMFAPFIASLSQYHHFLSPLMFSMFPLLAALLGLLLPETNKCELPQTLEEGENFGKKLRKSEVTGTTNLAFVKENTKL